MEDDPWGEVLASIAWAIRITYHTMLGATPGQLVYGHDMLHDVPPDPLGLYHGTITIKSPLQTSPLGSVQKPD
eukprot:8299385-Ditylum_brightwellii.AAC.1